MSAKFPDEILNDWLLAVLEERPKASCFFVYLMTVCIFLSILYRQ